MGKKIDKVRTPVFRVSFPKVFEPEKTATGNDKYSLVMLFDKKEDLTELNAMIKRVVLEKYPDGDLPKCADGTPFIEPRKDGDDRDYAGYPGSWVYTASSQFPPGILGEDKLPIMNQREFYAGCYAIATVNAYCWEHKKKFGVSVGLQNLMKIKDGESLAGGASAESDFAEIDLPGDETAEVAGGGTSILD